VQHVLVCMWLLLIILFWECIRRRLHFFVFCFHFFNCREYSTVWISHTWKKSMLLLQMFGFALFFSSFSHYEQSCYGAFLHLANVMVWMFVSLKIHVVKFNFQSDGVSIRRWGLWEVIRSWQRSHDSDEHPYKRGSRKLPRCLPSFEGTARSQ